MKMNGTTDKKVLLSVKGLSTYYYKINSVVKAVDGVYFDVLEGEIVALVGESGCGKTGTIMSINKLIQSPPGRTIAGQVMFDGKDLLSLTEKEMQQIRGKEISMIFQEPATSFNPVMTIGQQLREIMTAHLDLTKEELDKKSIDLLMKVGITEPEKRLGQYPFQLSGGMKQRVMIAMALACEPRLIIADEPTTALDVTVQLQILELMKKLSKEMGVSILIITHNLGIVARYADRVNVMYAGHIVESGTTFDVFKNPSHPYTKGLIASIPRLDRPVEEHLCAIEGQPPDLSTDIKGCAFYDRCRYVLEKCRDDIPSDFEIGCGHYAKCWLLQRGRKNHE